MKQQKQNSKGEQDAAMEVASVVINNQATAEENAIHRAKDTNSRVERTVTCKQFCCALTLMFVVLALMMTGVGKLVRGSYWFETEKILACEIRRLSDENNRQDSELNRKRHKIGYKNESILVYRGILENRPSMLERSRIESKERSEPFEFVNWSRPDDLVEAMFQLEDWECLQWVMRQPKWYSCLNAETYKHMTEFSQNLNATPFKYSAFPDTPPRSLH